MRKKLTQYHSQQNYYFSSGILVIGAQGIINHMFNLDPKRRPSFEELKYHLWLVPPGLTPMQLYYESMILRSSSDIMGEAYQTGKSFSYYALLDINPRTKTPWTKTPLAKNPRTKTPQTKHSFQKFYNFCF